MTTRYLLDTNLVAFHVRSSSPALLLIASHALAIRATLVTRNVREFRRVAGLAAEDWTR